MELSQYEQAESPGLSGSSKEEIKLIHTRRRRDRQRASTWTTDATSSSDVYSLAISFKNGLKHSFAPSDFYSSKSLQDCCCD